MRWDGVGKEGAWGTCRNMGQNGAAVLWMNLFLEPSVCQSIVGEGWEGSSMRHLSDSKMASEGRGALETNQTAGLWTELEDFG